MEINILYFHVFMKINVVYGICKLSTINYKYALSLLPSRN